MTPTGVINNLSSIRIRQSTGKAVMEMALFVLELIVQSDRQRGTHGKQHDYTLPNTA